MQTQPGAVLGLVLTLPFLLATMPPKAAPVPPKKPTEAPRAATMNNAEIDRVLRVLSKDLRRSPAGNVWELNLEGRTVLVITDERADRMRAMSPVGDAEKLSPALQKRMLQANFDAALDARYALAQGQIWSAFIHPLSPLTPKELVSGIAQVVQLAATFGTTFHSGALIFGGGDSQGLHERLYDRIMKKGTDI